MRKFEINLDAYASDPYDRLKIRERLTSEYLKAEFEGYILLVEMEYRFGNLIIDMRPVSKVEAEKPLNRKYREGWHINGVIFGTCYLYKDEKWIISNFTALISAGTKLENAGELTPAPD